MSEQSGDPVVNASPLILLARIHGLHLLRSAAARIIVPQDVLDELAAKDDGTADAVAATPWLQVVPSFPSPQMIRDADLGAGETAVIAWAHAHPGTTAIVDDRAARAFANRLSIPVRGTLGVVLGAKRRGMIPAARPVVDQLRAAGMYITDRMANAALDLVCE